MLFLKWFLIVLISIDFLFDFVAKCNKNKKISEHMGALVGVGLRAYVVYILITVWNV